MENRQTQILRGRWRGLLQGGSHALDPEFLTLVIGFDDAERDDQQNRSGIN